MGMTMKVGDLVYIIEYVPCAEPKYELAVVINRETRYCPTPLSAPDREEYLRYDVWCSGEVINVPRSRIYATPEEAQEYLDIPF